ncbi:hypothetical protein AMS68_007287 [Peltaster fructicola]|uniref:Uncharacterized protein n=1 Tax=Peltaster fructicola TaxID=286661 RepID=A0A6H0Y587_9PEZI|nr:hypothetical protein AMS68_007287 [Peltaster fructicola]
MDRALDDLVGPGLSPRSQPSKPRSLSDPSAVPAALAPSPNFRENLRRSSKDDYAIPTTPKASRRTDFPSQGLSLQMPAREMPSPAQLQRPPAPLSPQLDAHNIFIVQSQSQAASPVTSLPRHSRGLDFSRASTNLHHSTIAEQSSPDLSPVITQRGMNIPQRKMSVSSMALDSPHMGPVSNWGSLAPERSAVSSSVGSINMLVSDSEDNSSDEDASMGGDDLEDAIYSTPHVHKLQNQSVATPFTASHVTSGSVWANTNTHSPAAGSLLRTIRKSRLAKGSRRPNKSSSSASNSGYSSMASPRTTSPPPMKSIEGSNSLFGWPKSRRESLALGTDGLHLSSGNDSGDEGSVAAPSTPGVVRRPVTARRGNLLPKTKGFARIRAQLIEEASPVDSETRREAETIKQVRERDGSVSQFDLEPRLHSSTAPSSPSLLPAVQEDFDRELDAEATPMGKGLGVNFSLHAHRNGAGPGFWNRFDPAAGTPPPIFPPTFSRQSSTMNSEDSPIASGGENFQRMRGRAQSTASEMSDIMALGPQPASTASGMTDDMHLKKFKRRREDDFDIATIKRRAVSPGMSAQNSPVMTASPFQKDGNWGMPPERKREREINTASSEGSMSSQIPAVRSGSTGSVGTPVMSGGFNSHGKKLGLQGMVDTNDGLMKMSIE